MTVAHDIPAVFAKNGTATLMARVVGADGTVITQATISSGAYSIYKLDEHDPDSRTAVTGHTAGVLTIASVVYDTLQTGTIWDSTDSTGYNFAHTPSIVTYPAFAVAGVDYLVEYTLTPASGEKILVRFRGPCN